jgi:hypothetical protein
MGVYELMEGKEVNGRGVWQMAEGQEVCMYYANDKQWWISGRENMEAGESGGWVSVASTAPTPDQITETWQVSDGTSWVDAPKVRARMCSAEEKRAAAERLEQERQQAMSAAKQVRDICVEGQQQGDHHHDKMGGTASASQPAGPHTPAPNGHLIGSQWCPQPIPSKPKVHTNPLDRP